MYWYSRYDSFIYEFFCFKKKKIKAEIVLSPGGAYFEKWVTAKTKPAYRKINTTANPYNIDYQKLQNNLVENMGRDFLHNKVLTFNSLDTERDKWNFINEARNAKRTKTEIPSLKNSFSDTITDQKRIADLLKFRFSKLGDCFGQTKLYKNLW